MKARKKRLVRGTTVAEFKERIARKMRGVEPRYFPPNTVHIVKENGRPIWTYEGKPKLEAYKNGTKIILVADENWKDVIFLDFNAARALGHWLLATARES